MQKIVNIGVVFATHYKHLYRDLIAALKMENSCRQIFVYVADDTQKQYVNENFDLNLISRFFFTLVLQTILMNLHLSLRMRSVVRYGFLKKKIGYPQTAYWLLIGILEEVIPQGVFTMPNQAEQ